jgi:hypothetical protein
VVGRLQVVVQSDGFVQTLLEQQENSEIYSQVTKILLELELEIVLSEIPLNLLFNSTYFLIQFTP